MVTDHGFISIQQLYPARLIQERLKGIGYPGELPDKTAIHCRCQDSIVACVGNDHRTIGGYLHIPWMVQPQTGYISMNCIEFSDFISMRIHYNDTVMPGIGYYETPILELLGAVRVLELDVSVPAYNEINMTGPINYHDQILV